ncbi:MAG: hypothetical protein BWY82_02299 [Verrucomicrobia bacterium ADurb.Bin474]|nr:MAG: hypothetical protein BWY82_02299 [Verrucomicrobia bacterium ADurb.Bin474]
MSIGFAIPLHRILKGCAFVESIPAEMLDAKKTVDVTHPYLRPEFHRCVLLPPNNGPDPRLTQTDDAILDPIGSHLIHSPLLINQESDHPQPFQFPPRQYLFPFVRMLPDHSVDGL